MVLPWNTLSWSSFQVKKYEMKAMKRNRDTRMDSTPRIFQVRSSRASFCQSIDSFFSCLNAEVFVFAGLFLGVSAVFFFFFWAMATKITQFDFHRVTSNNHYPLFFTRKVVGL